MNQSKPKPVYVILAVSGLSLFSFLALYGMRSFDDNRLTSWRWTFTQVDGVVFFSTIIFGLGLAYILSRFDYLDRNPFFLFFSAFFSATLFWQVPEVIVDTSRYFTQAKHLKIYGIGYFFEQWGKNIPAWTDLPLVPFVYGLIFKGFGEQRLYIQIFTTLLFSMTVILTYMIGASLWDKNTGYVGGLLLLGIPYLFSQVPIMLVDVPAMFLLSLSIFTMIRALIDGGIGWMVSAAVALFLAFFSKYSNWLWLSALLPIILVYSRNAPGTTIKRSGAIALLALVFTGLAVWFMYDVIADQVSLLLSYQRPGLRRWGESFTSTFFFQTHPFITLAAVYSAYLAFRKKDLKYVIIGYLLFLVILLQIKRIRYTIPIFPMLTLMAAYGLSQIKNRNLIRFIAFSVVISSLTVAYFAYLPFLQRISAVNLKDAGRFLNTLDVAAVEVYTLEQKRSIINPAVSVPLLDLFTDKTISYHPGHNRPRNWDKIKKSSLRFTWEYTNPGYYIREKKGHYPFGAMVVISHDPDQPMSRYLRGKTRDYKNLKVFQTDTGLFRYRTVVTIYYN